MRRRWEQWQQFGIGRSRWELAGHRLPIPRTTLYAARARGDEAIIVGFRPESLTPAASGDGFPITVTLVEELGADAYCYGALDGHDPTQGQIDIVVRINPRDLPVVGTCLALDVTPDALHLFSASDGTRLPT